MRSIAVAWVVRCSVPDSWTHIATTVCFEVCKSEGLQALENVGSRGFGLTSFRV